MGSLQLLSMLPAMVNFSCGIMSVSNRCRSMKRSGCESARAMEPRNLSEGSSWYLFVVLAALY